MSFKGADSTAKSTKTTQVGNLEGFYECIVSRDVRICILLKDDAEEQYDITYVKGISYTVHMLGNDLVFHKKNKLHVADIYT